MRRLSNHDDPSLSSGQRLPFVGSYMDFTTITSDAFWPQDEKKKPPHTAIPVKVVGIYTQVNTKQAPPQKKSVGQGRWITVRFAVAEMHFAAKLVLATHTHTHTSHPRTDTKHPVTRQQLSCYCCAFVSTSRSPAMLPKNSTPSRSNSPESPWQPLPKPRRTPRCPGDAAEPCAPPRTPARA